MFRSSLRLALLGTCLALPAFAQTTPAPEPQPVQVDDPGQGLEALAPTVLPGVNTTATRNSRLLFDTPAVVDIIPGRDLERRMARDIQDVFRYTPGVSVNQQTSGTDPFGSLGGVSVRGVGGNRVLTIIDGARTMERITDQTRDVVEPWHLKRVEVVRGPASTLWGSDALGGVVQFVTRDPADYIQPGRNWGAEADSDYSTLDRGWRSRVTGAWRAGEFEGMIAYQRRQAHEQNRNNARSPDGIWNCTRAAVALPCNRLNPADINSDSLLGKLVWNAAPNNRIRLTAESMQRVTTVDQRYDLGPVTGGITNLSRERKQFLDRYRLGLDQEWTPGWGWLDAVRWQVGYHPQELRRTGVQMRRLANGQLSRIEDELQYSEDFWQGDLQLNSSFSVLGMRHALTYGFQGSFTETDYARRDVTTNLTTGVSTVARAGGFNFANADTRRLDGYIQDEISVLSNRLTVTPGLRYSTYRITPQPDADYRASPGAEPTTLDADDLALKLGAVLRLDETWSLFGNYGEGFKMPTAEQLFTSLPGASFNLVPNPDLKPESVRSYEGGIRMRLPRGYLSLSAFNAQYEDFIESLVNLPGTVDYTSRNLSSVKVWGIELAGAYEVVQNWTLQAAASWQRGRQRATQNSASTPFDGARPLKVVSGVNWTQPEWRTSLDVTGTFAAAADEASTAQRYRTRAYQVFDTVATWRPVENVELNLGIFNLFDARYIPQDVTGYDQSQFATAAVKSTNPIELQVAPGRWLRFGARVIF
ncbi:TonB-dependent hemoglobin/transferrin/lactoferrin family receptor [Roseomonas sp. 18066]|uniref:TonB-dependent hemoglobin/transferrin/lactoferrin family receptor n=1 Tax=Roseomonas sp. 18066 TaxID=2681412 RepID=UPI00135BB7F8|nr:TonB-dependent hemoglobin/transferrin/lactoferrin family receptor [Roseomonas sp. 18066]